MKKILSLFTAFFIVTTVAFSQEEKPTEILGFVELENGVHVDQTEISIGEWMGYAFNMVVAEGEDAKPFLPDMNAVPKKCHFMYEAFNHAVNEDLEDGHALSYTDDASLIYYYLDVPKSEKKILKKKLKTWLDMPVTGLSFEQVQKYIIWREVKMENFPNFKDSEYRVELFLQSPEEWGQHAKKAGPHIADSIKHEYPDTINSKGCYLLKIKEVTPCESSVEGIKLYGEGMVSSYSYHPDLFGVYNLYGNVAEMTSKKGVAKGGSHINYGKQCFPEQEQKYTKAEPWLGFRCYARIVKK
jgi:formylglycine-generating enzyme required for sulfatase activity